MHGRGKAAVTPAAASLFKVIRRLSKQGKKVTASTLREVSGRSQGSVCMSLLRLELAGLIERPEYERGKRREIRWTDL